MRLWRQGNSFLRNPPDVKWAGPPCGKALQGAWGILALLLLPILAITSIARNSIWMEEVTLWDDSTEKSPAESRPFTNKAGALNRLGRSEEAIAEYRKALERNPDDHFARHGLGFALTQLNRFTEAVSEYRKAIRIMNIPEFHEDLAVSLEKSGDVREAINEIFTLVRRTPDDIKLRSYLITLLVSIGEREAYLRGIIEKGRTSHDPLDLFEAGWACTALERNQEAEGYLRSTLKALPDFPVAGYFLGIVLGRLGKNDEARECLEKAMADPLIYRSGESHYNLGFLYQIMKDAPRAEREYLYALDMDPNNSKAHNNLGALYLSAGRRAEALAEFQAAVKADPKNSEARKNLSILTGPTLTTPLH